MATAFEPCANLPAMQTVLGECFDRSRGPLQPEQTALRQALSCYYSGNFVTGFRHGYVRESRALRHKAALPVACRPDLNRATAPSPFRTLTEVPTMQPIASTLDPHSIKPALVGLVMTLAMLSSQLRRSPRASTRSTPRSRTSTRSW